MRCVLQAFLAKPRSCGPQSSDGGFSNVGPSNQRQRCGSASDCVGLHPAGEVVKMTMSALFAILRQAFSAQRRDVASSMIQPFSASSSATISQLTVVHHRLPARFATHHLPVCNHHAWSSSLARLHGHVCLSCMLPDEQLELVSRRF